MAFLIHNAELSAGGRGICSSILFPTYKFSERRKLFLRNIVTLTMDKLMFFGGKGGGIKGKTVDERNMSSI